MSEPRIESFEAFWPYYLGEHGHPVNRRLHFLGTSAALAVAVASLVTLRPWLLPLALVAGYGPAWVGHFVVERNRPATFRYPLWSLRGDFRMFWLMLTGRLDAELAARR